MARRTRAELRHPEVFDHPDCKLQCYGCNHELITGRPCPEEYDPLVLWVSCRKMTGLIEVEDGIVRGGAPIFGRFVGQPVRNLRRWMRSKGEYREIPYKTVF